MAELNDKLITYGNLSTFYDKLQEQGLGGNAIEDVSVLPDASANKNKFVRLASDKKVYASDCISEGNAGYEAIILNGCVYRRYSEGDNTNEAEGYESYQICWNMINNSQGFNFDDVTDWNDLSDWYAYSETTNIGIGSSCYEAELMYEIYEVTDYSQNAGYAPQVWDWQPLTDNATNDDIDAMFESSSPVVKRVLMSDYASPLSIKEGLVNVSGETMEYDGQTYYKWVKYEEHDGESVIDDFGNDTELVVLTTSLNPSLPFSEESPEYAYHLVIDGGEGQYWGLDTYPEEALIHEDGSITYEE